jgi:N-methylhydantoinase A
MALRAQMADTAPPPRNRDGRMTRYWIGIDTGGTFTDMVLADTATGRHRYVKVPSNPADPAEAVLRGLDIVLAEAGGVPGGAVAFVALGTTLATNAVLEGKTGRAALIATAGFADVLDLARQRRPHLYDFDIPKPRPPVPSADRIEAVERLDADGAVLTPLDEAALEAALRGLDPGVQAVAICFLHSYRNPAHEERAAALLARLRPDVFACLSSEVSPEFREYERTATTAVNAALLPVMHRYLARFGEGVAARGIAGAPHVMQSGGGLASPATVQRRPVNTFFSGPAGGVIGAARIAGAAGFPDIVSFDIGGTSTDVCLVKDGHPARASIREMARMPVRTSSIDLHTIGAGGGSLAWVDAGGLPKVGPESAGAHPGPACYARGGTRPTVTDANVVLGRLNQAALLGGRMPIDAALAQAVVEEHVARPLGVDVVHAAAGILEIVNVNMMGAVRVISVEKGEDPRRFALFAFGGGGPLHAAEVAEGMEMPRVIVPAHPGLTSAIGLLAADIRGDFGLTCLAPATPEGLPVVRAALATLAERGRAWAADERLDASAVRTARALELRYLGQSSELAVPLVPGAFGVEELAVAVTAFHEAHRARFGYAMPDRGVEAVAARLVAIAQRPDPPPETAASDAPSLATTERRAWFRATGFIATPVLDRRAIAPGASVAGPAILEQMDTTTVVPPGWTARADHHHDLILEREGRAAR